MRIGAVVFDLDGVVTDTASVHARAWKRLFDEFLAARARSAGAGFVPFSIDSDYRELVDGKPRYEGVRAFLESRGLHSEPAVAALIVDLGDRKDSFFTELLATEGVTRFESTVLLARGLSAAGVGVGIATSSRNAGRVLDAAGLGALFPVRVDGVVSARDGLRGKPAPDIFVECCRLLDCKPADSVIIEDALVGVAAGRAGGFGLVLGIDRVGQVEELRASGADVVLKDLGGVTPELLESWLITPGSRPS